MSGAGSELQAKVVITGDAKGVVGASAEAKAALKGVQSETAGVTTKVKELTAAHAAHDAAVRRADDALKRGLITQVEYKAAVRGAAAELELARLGGDRAAVSAQRLEMALARAGAAGGIARSQIMALKAAVDVLPAMVAAFPLETALAGVAVALGGLILAQQYYETSMRQVDIAMAAHVQTLQLTREEYVSLASDIAAAAQISNRSARSFETQLLNNNVNPNTWNDLAASVRGYAKATGVDLAQAQTNLAQSMAKPSELLKELQKRFPEISDDQIALAEHLERTNHLMDAQGMVAGALRDHIAALGSETGFWDRMLENAGTHLSDILDKMGQWSSKAAGLIPGGVKRGAQTASSYIPWWIDPIGALFSDPNKTGTGTAIHPTDNTPQTQSLSSYWSEEAAGVGKSVDAHKHLNRELESRLAHIRELIRSAPQDIAEANQLAASAIAQASAIGLSNRARQDLLDSYEIERAVLPETTALQFADLKAKAALLDKIEKITDAMRRRQQAEREIAAASALNTGVLGLSTFAGASAQADRLALQRKQLQDNFNDGLSGLAGVSSLQGYTDYYRKLKEIFDDGMAALYRDDLSRQRDWASGIRRGLDDLTRSQEDWATTSENLVKGAAQSFEDDFVNSVLRSKEPLSGFFDWFAEQLLRTAYQMKIAPVLNPIFGSIVDGLGGLLGGGSQTMNSSLGGARAGGGPVNSNVPYLVGEEGPELFTPSSSGTITSHAALTSGAMPIGGGSRAAVEVHVHPAPGTKATVKQSQNADGGTRIDVFNELVDQVDGALAEKQRRGTSAHGAAIADTHQLERRVR